MISRTNPRKNGASDNDYFKSDGAQPPHPGQWLGMEATFLELHEEPNPAGFKNLLAGKTLDGTRTLVGNSGNAHDALHSGLTITASKSISRLSAHTPKKVRKRISRTHKLAVKMVLDHLTS